MRPQSKKLPDHVLLNVQRPADIATKLDSLHRGRKFTASTTFFKNHWRCAIYEESKLKSSIPVLSGLILSESAGVLQSREQIIKLGNDGKFANLVNESAAEVSRRNQVLGIFFIRGNGWNESHYQSIRDYAAAWECDLYELVRNVNGTKHLFLRVPYSPPAQPMAAYQQEAVSEQGAPSAPLHLSAPPSPHPQSQSSPPRALPTTPPHSTPLLTEDSLSPSDLDRLEDGSFYGEDAAFTSSPSSSAPRPAPRNNCKMAMVAVGVVVVVSLIWFIAKHRQ